jgi:hypothetical protein
MDQWMADQYGPLADWLYVNGYKVVGLPAGLLFLATYLFLYFVLPGIMRRGIARWAIIAWPICVVLFVPPYWRALGTAIAIHQTSPQMLDVVMWRWLDMIGLVVAAVVCLLLAISFPFFKNDGDGVTAEGVPRRSDRRERPSDSWMQRELHETITEQERVAKVMVAMRNQSPSG